MKIRRIIIHIDEVRRDAVSLHLLGFLLEKKGWEVWYANRSNLNSLIELLEPSAVTMHNLSTVAPDIILKFDKKTDFYIIPGEFYLTNEDVIRRVYKKNNYRDINTKIKKIFSWGSYQKKKLIELNIFEENQISVTGCYRHDLLKISYENNIIKKGKSIGVISNLGPINVYDDRNIFQCIDSLRNCHGTYYPKDRELEDFYWTYYSTARMTFELLDEIILNQQKKILYRPHQRENMFNYKYFSEKYGNNFEIDTGEFHEFLFKNKAFAAFASTSLLEALMFNQTAISLNRINYQRHQEHFKMPNYFYFFLKFCRSPETIEEAVDMLISKQQGFNYNNRAEEFKQHVKEYFDHPHSYFSCEKIADEINKTCEKQAVTISNYRKKRILLKLYKKHLNHIICKKIKKNKGLINNNFCPWCHADKINKAKNIFKYVERLL